MSLVKTSLQSGANMLLDLVLPPRCPFCGDQIPQPDGFCVSCWSQLRFITDPACQSCGRPMPEGSDDDMVCAPCLADPPSHDGIGAAVIYDDLSRQVALRMKYGGRIGLARMIARYLERHVAGHHQALLVPVPLHRGRLWSRGFNQAVLIASALAKTYSLEHVPDMLLRKRPTPPLKGLRKAQRKAVLKGAFAENPKKAAQIAGRDILLVDDIYTSGATTDGCIRILRKHGARSVKIICWARVLRDGETAQLL